MPLFRIRLELARTKDHPSGSTLHGYEFVAPLDERGHLSTAEWKANKTKCTVRRYAPGVPDEHGHLIDVGRGWHFDYDQDGYEDDEPLFKLDRHEIRVGEYLSITEHDGQLRPYRIALVVPV
ncbi:MAG TPA: hypothetical protein DCL54_11590 [Alphaproteobacteria bacterium]|nr:hypothetical protein [Alphaproteobacteria bacterium]